MGISSFIERKALVLAPVFLVLVALWVRWVYHLNFPLFEDEGFFLVDARNFWHLYENSLFMKPPLGALFYHFANYFSAPFLALHVMTTFAILIAGYFIYRIVMAWTNSYPIVILSCLTYLYCTAATVDGYGHSSLEHFQNLFLLAAFYWLFVKERFYAGAVSFILSALVLHNVLLALPATWDFKKKHLMFLIAFTVIVGGLVYALFPNILFNCLTFPAKYYGSQISWEIKWVYLQRYLRNPVMLSSVLLSIPGLIYLFKEKTRAAIFIGLVILSVLLTKQLYLQHMLTIYPLLTLLMALALHHWQRFLPVVKIACVLMLVALFYVNQKAIAYISNQGLFQHYTYQSNWSLRRMDSTRMAILTAELEKHPGQTAYIYPNILPFMYGLTQTNTISTFASNDNFAILVNNAALRQKLIKSIQSERPDLLIRIEPNALDAELKAFISANYTCELNHIQICQRKGP